MDSSNIVTLIFMVAAVFVFLQLRSVLGKRTGHERPPMDFPTPGEKDQAEADADADADMDDDNVITLPNREGADQYREIDRVAKSGTALNKQLRGIKDVSPAFSPREFLSGAGMAYEMIVMAFADGDRKTLQNLLSKEVYEGFADALTEREKAGETVQTNFVGIEKMDIVGAELRDNSAHVTVSVVSQLISATTDGDGKIIDGDPNEVAEVRDEWTFAKDIRDRDPNWKLISTEPENA
ncbi:MAG: Tim44/TimA family putative adaptor protein [Pseudomonadota bacterium]